VAVLGEFSILWFCSMEVTQGPQPASGRAEDLKTNYSAVQEPDSEDFGVDTKIEVHQNQNLLLD